MPVGGEEELLDLIPIKRLGSYSLIKFVQSNTNTLKINIICFSEGIPTWQFEYDDSKKIELYEKFNC